VSPDFDFEATFNDNYFYFYSSRLTDELNLYDAEVVRSRLALQPGERVLDAPCGHGRIANLLAADGCVVVGVDAAQMFLDRARADAAALGVDVDYRRGDLRALPVADGEFDAALSWFTSFGYFDDADNQAVLGEYARVLKPGGRLGSAVWIKPEDNPWTSILMQAIATEAAVASPDPDRPNMFRCAAPGFRQCSV
jgi:SAM-dependent methyltransferase